MDRQTDGRAIAYTRYSIMMSQWRRQDFCLGGGLVGMVPVGMVRVGMVLVGIGTAPRKILPFAFMSKAGL